MLIPAVMLSESYWQQEVKYNIEAALDPGKQTITGTETLDYKNNSPDVLNVVYFRLYWNLFTKGSYGEKYSIRNKQYYSMPESGIRLLKFAVIENDGELLPEYAIDNTLMEVKLPKPLQPGESLKFSVGWVGKIPEGGCRTGRQGKDYNIAQWYPQIATYDKHGWDKSQYLGPAEFYNEYGSFDVKLSIPKSYTLGYSGRLLNPEEVYPDSVLTRLKDSEGNPETIRIADYSGTKWNDADTALVTWKFQAENVRDFAFSANEHYIWDVAHWSPGPGSADVAIHSLYFPDKAEFWKNTAKYGQHTISFLSRHFGQYAYPNCFIVEGVVGGGMEYPGITFIGHYGDKEYHSPFGVVTHEVAHNWYPMMVGSDETYYAFMDEGFTTFLTALATEDYFGRHDNSFEWTEWYQRFFAFPNSDERRGIQNNYFWLAKSGAEEPICTHAYRFEQGQAGTSIYSKTAAVLFMLQYLLGDSTFESAMNLYFDRWKFKHPYPEDFYRVMEEAGGNRDLRWFFDQSINRTDRCDYGISDFDYDRVSRDGVSFYRATVSVRRYQSAIMPVDVELTMDDGSKDTIWFPIDKWLNAEVERDTVIDLPRMPVKAEINPDGRILDINRLNNRYPLPKFAVNFDNTLFGVTPVDAYLIEMAAFGLVHRQGRLEHGIQGQGQLSRRSRGGFVWNAYNTRDNSFNYDLNISHNSYRITPMSEISLRYYRMEGRSGASLSLQKQLRRNFSVPPSHTLRFTYSFSRVDDQSYLWIPESWEKGDRTGPSSDTIIPTAEVFGTSTPRPNSRALRPFSEEVSSSIRKELSGSERTSTFPAAGI